MRHTNRMLREGKDLDEVLSVLRVRKSVWKRWQVRYSNGADHAAAAGAHVDGPASPHQGED